LKLVPYKKTKVPLPYLLLSPNSDPKSSPKQPSVDSGGAWAVTHRDAVDTELRSRSHTSKSWYALGPNQLITCSKTNSRIDGTDLETY
jgi:hypothetical protein